MSNLLDINVDTLFEQNSVQEIEQIHRKLQNDVEAKKEELRTMVGERYRDLLKAADTIGEMKTTGESVTKHIADIMSSCRSLNEKQLIGFKNSTDLNQQAVGQQLVNREIQNFYGITVQIHLLSQFPELIWTSLDCEDYFVATQLFVFSRHISTGLQLDINHSIMKSFPVAKKLWSILRPFSITIKQSCMTTLEREQLSAETASKCLASILLLDNCNIEKLLQTFIQLRSKAFKKTLVEERSGQRVKDRILTSLAVLSTTLDLIFKCFIAFEGNSGGLLKLELENLTSANAMPTIHLINTENSLIISTLPDIIAKFKPHIKFTELPSDTLKQIMESWLQFSRNDSMPNLKLVIDVIASIKTIHSLRLEASRIEKPQKWSKILQKLHLPDSLDLYRFLYEPLISQRVKDIIRSSWSETVRETYSEISELIKLDQKRMGNDELKSLIWTQEPGDIPLSLKQALSTDRLCHKLLLKSKGYTVGIVRVCQILDSKLKILFDDLSLYLTGGDEARRLQSEGNEIDQSEIVAFLRESSSDGISELIANIKSTQYERSQSSSMLLATLLKSLSELCPHLKLCLLQNISKNFDKISVNNSEQWDRVCRLLDDESLQFWRQWVEIFVTELLATDLHGHCINIVDNFTALIRELSAWETIIIEEKDELDNPIQSTIRVPSQPSLSLQSFFHRICSILNKSVPHTMPQNITTLLTDAILMRLIQNYKICSTNEFCCGNQNVSLQYFFDIKFVNILMVTSRDNKQTNDSLQSLAATFKSNIDPFDFELFHKYILINVKKSAQRMQHKLGSIIPNNMEHLTTVFGGGGQQQLLASLQDKDPNVLALSSAEGASNWFPLLPVMLSSSMTSSSSKDLKSSPNKLEDENKGHRQHNAKPSSSTASVKSSTQQQLSSLQQSSAQNLANVKSGAAAFLQDWFR